MSERIEADGAKPADSGRVTDEVLELACAAYNKAMRDAGYDDSQDDGLSYASPMALRAALAAQGQGEPEEMSPEFTDSARGAIAWVLYHHKGGSSPIGQPLRFALGMGTHERIPDAILADAKRWAKSSGATTAQFHPAPPASPAGVPDGDLTGGLGLARFQAQFDDGDEE